MKSSIESAESAAYDRANRARRVVIITGAISMVAVTAAIVASLVAVNMGQQVAHLNNTQTPAVATLAAANTEAAMLAAANAEVATLAFGATFSALELNRFLILNDGDIVVPLGTQTPDIFEPTLTQIAVLQAHDPSLPENQKVDAYGVEMMFVPRGCFFMGSDRGNDSQKPTHQVCLDSFWIDKYEVTNTQFDDVSGVGEQRNYFCDQYHDRTSDGNPDDCAQHPRQGVTWFEAHDYCEKQRGARLPTEAEWEYAARGPDGWVYPWGNEFIEDNAVYSQNSKNQTAEVGSRPNGASWVAALDLIGNVSEWTNSLRQPYPYKAYDGRENDTVNRPNDTRVLRGGSFSTPMNSFSVASRFFGQPAEENYSVGFRCVLSE